ncbi:MAG: hypothetical protein H8E25_18035 [Planctomycetes bacterium]|nr:hypothetical protein [Planctomycetota bacterium]
MIGFALLALSVTVPSLITPSQALLGAIAYQLLNKRQDNLFHFLCLYAVTLVLQALRDDSVWWHATLITLVAIAVAGVIERSARGRLLLVYTLCLPPVLAMINATGMVEGDAIESFNPWQILAVNKDPALPPLLLDKALHPQLANTYLPLPSRFAPYPLYAGNGQHGRGLLISLLVILFAAFAIKRRSTKILSVTVLLAAFAHFYFSPPSSAYLWMPAADGSWLVQELSSDGAGLLRQPFSSEVVPSTASYAELAFAERHPRRAPITKGPIHLQALLELWMSAAVPATFASIPSENRYLGQKRYSVDANGYLLIAPLP